MQSDGQVPYSLSSYVPQAPYQSTVQNGVHCPGNVPHNKDMLYQQPVQHHYPNQYAAYNNVQPNQSYFTSPPAPFYPQAGQSSSQPPFAHPTTSVSSTTSSQYPPSLSSTAVQPSSSHPNYSYQYPVSTSYNPVVFNQTQNAYSTVPNQSWTSPPNNPPPPSGNSLAAPLQSMHLNGSGTPTSYSPPFPSHAHNVSGPMALPSYGVSATSSINLLLDQVDSTALSWQLQHTNADSKPESLVDNHTHATHETPANAVCCTVGGIPRTPALANRCRLPLGLHIQPLAVLSSDSLALVQPRDIIRCQRCRSYINPYVRWIYGYGAAANDQWECSVCLSVNRTASPLDSDLLTSALRYSSVDYAAPADYVQSPPKPPVYTFIFDVTQGALESGYLPLVCSRLLNLLHKDLNTGVPLPGDRRTRVAILTYDSAVHFYRLDEEVPQIFVCPDLEEPYVPCATGLLCNLVTCIKNVQYLLEQLPLRWNLQSNANSTNVDSTRSGNALGAALKAALLLLKGTGGRVFLFNGTLPNKEPGSLAHRDDIAMVNSARASPDKIEKAIGPATDFYKQLSLELSTMNITVSLFAPSHQFMDLATISALSRYTGGKLFHYQSFRLPLRSVQEWTHFFASESCTLLCKDVCGLASAHRLWSDLGEHLNNCNVALEAVMRVRCPKEVTIRSFFGNTFVRSVDLISLPTVHEDAAFSVHMDLQQEIPSSVNCVCFQVALLYSSVWGERRLRVHTLRVPVVDHAIQVFQSANGLAIMGMLTRFACSRSLVDVQMNKARDALISALQDIYRSYGDECGVSGGSDALWAPTALQYLALHTNALMRSKALRVSPATPMDSRVNALSFFFSAPLHSMLLEIYPQFYRIQFSTSGDLSMQHQLCRLSVSFLDRNGVFVLITSLVCFVLVRRGMPCDIVRDLFRVNSFTELPEFTTLSLSTSGEENPRRTQFLTLLDAINVQRSPIVVIRDDAVLKDDLLAYLVDHQKAENALSYPEFLRFLRGGFRYKSEGK